MVEGTSRAYRRTKIKKPPKRFLFSFEAELFESITEQSSSAIAKKHLVIDEEVIILFESHEVQEMDRPAFLWADVFVPARIGARLGIVHVVQLEPAEERGGLLVHVFHMISPARAIAKTYLQELRPDIVLNAQ